MTRDEVMERLEALGTAQARKTYARHGAGDNTFGVSFANLYKLQKQIRKDHGLARQLWKTRNLDAQSLATMIADAGRIDSREADDWAKDSQHHARRRLQPAGVTSEGGRRVAFRQGVRSVSGHDRAGDPRLAEPCALFDEHRPDCDRHLSARADRRSAQGGEADREGGRRSRRHGVQDAGCGAVHSESSGPEKGREGVGRVSAPA